MLKYWPVLLCSIMSATSAVCAVAFPLLISQSWLMDVLSVLAGCMMMVSWGKLAVEGYQIIRHP